MWRFLAYTEVEKWSNFFYLKQLHQTGNIGKTQIRLSVVAYNRYITNIQLCLLTCQTE